MPSALHLIYSTHARWYVSIPSTVDHTGRLRRALVIVSPHSDEPQFAELDGPSRIDHVIERASELVEGVFWTEDWYRRPRQIRCDSAELTAALAARLGDATHVRTDTTARTFRTAHTRYRDHVMAVPSRKGTG